MRVCIVGQVAAHFAYVFSWFTVANTTIGLLLLFARRRHHRPASGLRFSWSIRESLLRLFQTSVMPLYFFPRVSPIRLFFQASLTQEKFLFLPLLLVFIFVDSLG